VRHCGEGRAEEPGQKERGGLLPERGRFSKKLVVGTSSGAPGRESISPLSKG